MDFLLTDEQKLIQQTAREFAQNEVAKDAAERDQTAQFPSHHVKKMAELGFMGMMIDPKYGGNGLDTVSYAIVIEELSRVDASVGVICSVSNSLVCFGIENFGKEETKQKYLVPLAKGEKLGAFCMSEPGSGSDAAGMKTTAVLKGDHYILNGTKNFITNGLNADYYVVIAHSDPSQRHKGISAFVVEKGFPGFQVGKKEKKLGIRSSDTASIMMEDCAVPRENLLGQEGEGFKVAMMTLDGGRIGIASQAVGIAQGSLDAAINYAKERVQFGKPISAFQSIQHMLADMETRVNAARLLTYQAAWKKDQNQKYSHDSAKAKLFASETAVDVSSKAVQIFGGYGYLKDYPVERFMRDSKITEIYEGTSEIQRLVIARELLK
ncbi:acyl-CoA dehydrogenase [candidate division KSB1 bacterium]|nr:acyl-CoA dehydrogenase [candidate division KSB1 bacterium]